MVIASRGALLRFDPNPVQVEAGDITDLNWEPMKTTIRVGRTLAIGLALGLLLTPMEVLSSTPGTQPGVDTRAAAPEQPDQAASEHETHAPAVL